MANNVGYETDPKFMISNSVLTDICEFAGNIFMINFLVAILSNVFAEMQEKGEFDYKSTLYNFIEKYNIPIQDDHGYGELIIHPVPINACTLLLIPFALKKSIMKKAAELFAKAMFWIENFFYIVIFFMYEFCLVPYLYIKMFSNIVKLSNASLMLPLILLWSLFGFLYLFLMIFKDMFYFLKILCDYQEDEDKFKEKEEEDFK